MNERNSGDTVALPQPHGGTLRPFQPGQSGNPSGRPIGRRSLATIIKDMLENELDFSKLDTGDAAKLATAYHGKTAWEALVITATIQALQGNIKAADWLARNAYGNRQIIENDPPLVPLSPVMQQAINRQLQVQQAGEKALQEGAA